MNRQQTYRSQMDKGMCSKCRLLIFTFVCLLICLLVVYASGCHRGMRRSGTALGAASVLPPRVWVLEVDLQLWDLVVRSLPSEPSHQTSQKKKFFLNDINHHKKAKQNQWDFNTVCLLYIAENLKRWHCIVRILSSWKPCLAVAVWNGMATLGKQFGSWK